MRRWRREEARGEGGKNEEMEEGWMRRWRNEGGRD